MSDYAFIDHGKLLTDLKRGDEAAIIWAYRSKFSDQVGRFILTHQMAEAGVGQIRGPGMDHGDSRYHDGRADHALLLLNLAGFDQMSAAHAVAANILEGQDHERSEPQSDAGTSTEPGPGPE